MNKYDELLDRAKMFYDQPMVGELMNAVRELKDKEEHNCSICHIHKYDYGRFCGECGERKEDA